VTFKLGYDIVQGPVSQKYLKICDKTWPIRLDMKVLWNSYDQSYNNLLTNFYLKIELSHKIVLWSWPIPFLIKTLKNTEVHFVGFFNSISRSKVELTQYNTFRLTDISMQKVKIPQENGKFFLPQTSYENTCTMGEKMPHQKFSCMMIVIWDELFCELLHVYGINNPNQ
jgi:hypothetical protein